MKTASRNIFWATLLIGAIAVLAPQTALAGGTAANTTITNSATVNYSVNSVAQPTPAAVTTTFRIDDKVMFTVTAIEGSSVTILPGGRAMLSFRVDNTGNGPHDFTLNPVLLGGNSFAPAASGLYSDATGSTPLPTNANAGSLPYISNIASDGTQTVYLYITAPATPLNGNTANYSLTAEAYQDGTLATVTPGLTSTQAGIDAGLDKNSNLNALYYVLADASGTALGDGARDGKYGVDANAGFLVQSASIAIAKSGIVSKDQFASAKPKAIPGSTITYQVTVTNSGSAGTSSLSIQDTLPGNVTLVTQYDDASNHCAAGENVVIDTVCFNTGSLASGVLTIPGLSVASGGGQTIVKYQVTIN